nr:MAG TPA: hypothetical protein [Caudoviricetes sp.]
MCPCIHRARIHTRINMTIKAKRAFPRLKKIPVHKSRLAVVPVITKPARLDRL